MTVQVMKADVLVVFPHHASFIDRDIAILGKEFDVGTLEYRRKSDRFALLRELRRSRVAVALFALGYAYAMVRLSRLHGARTVLIPGGWDVESIPELNYGAMRLPRTITRTSYALSNADRILAVSEYTRTRVQKWAPAAEAQVLYHGFDSESFTPDSKDRSGVVTVARISPETWKLKGLQTFTEAARRLPDSRFTIVGEVTDPEILSSLPENVSTPGYLTQDRLLEQFRAAKVYAQLSAVESFGCSLAEAMLSGCIPVVTNRGAIPEVVGNLASPVAYGDVEQTVRALLDGSFRSDGEHCRQWILSRFPLENRARGLCAEIHRLLDGDT